MKLFGHPVHLMLIHFPAALLPMEFVCSLIAAYTANLTFVITSFYCMVVAVLLGFAAIITGTFDLLHVIKENPNAVKKALTHGGINATLIIVYSIIAFSTFKQYPNLRVNSSGLIIAKGVLVSCMLLGNYLGGSLILKDKIAVEK